MKTRGKKMKLLTIQEVQAKQLELMKKLHTFLVSNHIQYYFIGGSALGAVRHNDFIPWDDDIDIGMFRSHYENFLSICQNFDPNYDIVNFHNAKNCDNCLTRIYFPNTYIDATPIKNTQLDSRLYFDIFPIDNVPDDDAERLVYEKQIKKKKNLISKIDARNYHNSAFVFFLKKAISVCLTPFRSAILKSTDTLMKKYMNENTIYVCSLNSQYSFKKQVMLRTIYGTPKLHVFADSAFFIPENVDEYLTILFGDDYMQIPPENKRRKGYDIYELDGEK